MEQDFYKNKFLDEKINLIVPGEEDRKYIHQVITKELFFGIRNPESKERFIAIVHSLIGQGAKGIILGCTEIPMLIGQEDFSFPVFDTTVIHAMAAVDFALKS